MRCVVQFVYGRNKLFKRLCRFFTSNRNKREQASFAYALAPPSGCFGGIAYSHIKCV